jgi:hypothetical protein
MLLKSNYLEQTCAGIIEVRKALAIMYWAAYKYAIKRDNDSLMMLASYCHSLTSFWLDTRTIKQIDYIDKYLARLRYKRIEGRTPYND